MKRRIACKIQKQQLLLAEAWTVYRRLREQELARTPKALARRQGIAQAMARYRGVDEPAPELELPSLPVPTPAEKKLWQRAMRLPRPSLVTCGRAVRRLPRAESAAWRKAMADEPVARALEAAAEKLETMNLWEEAATWGSALPGVLWQMSAVSARDRSAAVASADPAAAP